MSPLWALVLFGRDPIGWYAKYFSRRRRFQLQLCVYRWHALDSGAEWTRPAERVGSDVRDVGSEGEDFGYSEQDGDLPVLGQQRTSECGPGRHCWSGPKVGHNRQRCSSRLAVRDI